MPNKKQLKLLFLKTDATLSYPERVNAINNLRFCDDDLNPINEPEEE